MNIEEYIPCEWHEYEAISTYSNVIKTKFPIKKVKECEIAYLIFERDRFLLEQGRLPKYSSPGVWGDERLIKERYSRPYRRNLINKISSIVGNELILDTYIDELTIIYVGYLPDILIRKPTEEEN